MAKKNKPFDGVFSQLQEVDGLPILYDRMGSPSVLFEIKNPVQKLCTDEEEYLQFHNILLNISQTLGEGYALQKQDVFCKQTFVHHYDDDMEFLSKCYFKYFNGRTYTEIKTYLIITQQSAPKNSIVFDEKKWKDFVNKASKINDILTDKNIEHHILSVPEINEYVHRYMAMNFTNNSFSLNNLKAGDEGIKIGTNDVRCYSLVDIDEINMPSFVTPFTESKINGYSIASDLMGFLSDIPNCDTIVYNQVIQIPHQRKLLRSLQQKAKRHQSMPDPSNKIAQAEIEQVLDYLALETGLLVHCNFNIITSCNSEFTNPVSTYIESKLYDIGVLNSKSAYNQLELFIASFPGNAYGFNKEYDLFLTLNECALSFFFKEHLKDSEVTPLEIYYTDRQGLPVAIDITGKEGSVKYTDNANFFCIGPSGSGKSFHMNSVVRQLIQQNTDVVMVDTGDSYEGICNYFNGVYISYSKEHPISMNPFKITPEEYSENFGEKKNFLKSLIFLIYKGNQLPSKIEDTIINQTIVEYYDAFFHPFKGFTEDERETLRQKLLITMKMDSDFTDYQEDMESIEEQIKNKTNDQLEDKSLIKQNDIRRVKLLRQCQALQSVIDNDAASLNERQTALMKLEQYKKELYETRALIKIEKQIDHLEQQKLRLKVDNLSFNSYYEFALERIPQICNVEKIKFEIRDFAAILKQFYKGGELENTLNSDLDINLFDEKFIVFEIDKIKDDPILFPIVVLIIMDVFLQKMRIKKGRKALIIEEAWKAIASPTMAEYIKYLYKTVRKFHGIAGVVTQELNDVIDSPIVKEAIINNSDIKILLDQTKFKDRYEDISKILGLTPVQKKQIFTINALNNKENRNYFKEVWICRGLVSDVFGVEEPPECYWAYTTERSEKEALKIYLRYYGNIQDAIVNIEKDRLKAGFKRYFDFAAQINKHKKIMSLWED